MSTPERRHLPRTTLERLAYIDIESNNGGIVLNVSTEGLCFHSIAAVERMGRSVFRYRNKIAASRPAVNWHGQMRYKKLAACDSPL
jgi:hypothetical protein